jgi:hypothetical protein
MRGEKKFVAYLKNCGEFYLGEKRKVTKSERVKLPCGQNCNLKTSRKIFPLANLLANV